MDQSPARRNIDTVRRFYAAGPAADDTERRAFFAADAIWHVPGNNPVSGAYRGIDAIANDMVGRMQPLDAWRIEPREIMPTPTWSSRRFTSPGSAAA